MHSEKSSVVPNVTAIATETFSPYFTELLVMT